MAKTKKKSSTTVHTLMRLFCGFAVLVNDATEYWKYNPSFLTPAQRKKIGVQGWKKIQIEVWSGDKG